MCIVCGDFLFLFFFIRFARFIPFMTHAVAVSFASLYLAQHKIDWFSSFPFLSLYAHAYDFALFFYVYALLIWGAGAGIGMQLYEW